jgi:hypothetical protein
MTRAMNLLSSLFGERSHGHKVILCFYLGDYCRNDMVLGME